MQIELWIKDRSRYLLNASVAVNVAVAVVATAFGVLTLDLTAEQLTLMATLVGVFTTIASVTAEARAARRQQVYRGLAAQTLPATRENLRAAITEVHQFPDHAAAMTAVTWLAIISAVGLGMYFVGDAPLGITIRMVALAALFGSLCAALVNLLVLRRARVVIEALAEGLTTEEVLKAMPATRLQVRARLVAVTVALVVLPTGMLVDVGRHQTQVGLQKVIAQPAGSSAQRSLAAVEKTAVYVRLGFLFAAVLGSALLAAWVAGSVMADPMRRVAAEANKMARGELGPPRVFAASDEVWAVTSTFSQMHTQLHAVLEQLSAAGTRIASTTSELVGTSQGYEAGAAQQAASLNETSATTEELARSARQIAANAAEVQAISQHTLDAANAGQASAEEFARSVDRMRQDNRSIAEAVTRLQRRVQQIGKIVEFITGVADRSDLLALSAELEGTKAGDVGRSFSLVAAEMRRLAENVLESTTEIEELITEVRDATESTVQATEAGLAQTSSGTALASEVTRALAEVVRLAQETSAAVRGITLATQQQQTGTDQLAEAMADILGITQQSLAATKQLSSANSALLSLSGSLSTLVGKWKAG